MSFFVSVWFDSNQTLTVNQSVRVYPKPGKVRLNFASYKGFLACGQAYHNNRMTSPDHCIILAYRLYSMRMLPEPVRTFNAYWPLPTLPVTSCWRRRSPPCTVIE